MGCQEGGRRSRRPPARGRSNGAVLGYLPVTAQGTRIHGATAFESGVNRHAIFTPDLRAVETASWAGCQWRRVWGTTELGIYRTGERSRHPRSTARSPSYTPDAARAVVKTSEGLIQEGASASLEIALRAALPRFSCGKLSSFKSLSV